MVASVHSNCSPFRASLEFNQSPILSSSFVPCMSLSFIPLNNSWRRENGICTLWLEKLSKEKLTKHRGRIWTQVCPIPSSSNLFQSPPWVFITHHPRILPSYLHGLTYCSWSFISILSDHLIPALAWSTSAASPCFEDSFFFLLSFTFLYVSHQRWTFPNYLTFYTYNLR